jgi:hypothetical protein
VSRPVENVLWLLSALLAVVVTVFAGFFTFFGVLAWSLVVMPLARQRWRQQLHWLPRYVAAIWVGAVASALGCLLFWIAGLGADTSEALGWLALALVWFNLPLSCLAVVLVTFHGSVRRPSTGRSALPN